MNTAAGWIAKTSAVLSVACFWTIPFSPVLAMVAVSTTKRTTGWPRRLAVTGAVLSIIWTLMVATLVGWLAFLGYLNGSWAF